MRARTSIAVALAAGMAAGSLGITSAAAAPAARLPALHQASGNDAPLIEVASRKRHRGNNAAAAAAFMGIAGAMIGLAAQDSYRHRYYDEPSYYYDRGYRGRTYYRSYPGHPPGYSGPPLGNPALGQVTTPAQPDSLR